MNIIPKCKLLNCIFLLVLYGSFSSLNAQSDPTGERRVTGTYAITNATITTSPGKTIQNGTILIKDGLVIAVGSKINLPTETQIILGDSLFIYPGFIDGASGSGVSKPSDLEKPSDFNPSKPSDEIAGISPWKSVLDHFDPKSSQISEWRKLGFTIAHLIPEGGMLPGKSAIVIYGNNYSSNILTQNTGLLAKFQGSRGMYPGTVLGVMAKFRDLYQNAELSSTHGRLFASNVGLNRPEINKTLEAFYPVLDKNIPIYFQVTDDLEIRRAISLQNELGFKMVLVGVTDVEHVIDVIKSSNIQVLMSLTLPDDQASKAKKEGLSEDAKLRKERVVLAYEKSLKQASLLENAGVNFGFASSGSKSGSAMKHIRLMIENGLSEEAALAALTVNNASILGIQKYTGTLERGKLANMVISTKPLFEEEALIKYVVADGYLFEIDDKAKDSENDDSDAVDIGGEWHYSSDTPAGSGTGTINFDKSDDSYSGTITYDDPSGGGTTKTELREIQLSNKNLQFQFDVNVGGTLYQMTVSGEIVGDSFSGELFMVDAGKFPFTATKKPKSPNK